MHQSGRPCEQHDVSCQAILSMNIPFPFQILNQLTRNIPAPCHGRALKTVKAKASAKRAAAPAVPKQPATKPGRSNKRRAPDAADSANAEPSSAATPEAKCKSKKKKAPKK